jgi:ATP-dependent Clp protease adaptor protein ClpS
MSDNRTGTLEEIRSETGIDADEPSMYKVLLLNDDYTTMDFVVDILRFVFHKKEEEAIAIMFNVHKNGEGICGIYTFEIAEAKVNIVHSLARENGFPLKCIMEKE